MPASYDHSQTQTSLEGARTALAIMFGGSVPQSLVDVGCGTGTWVRAAIELGVDDVLGVDGADLANDQLRFPWTSFRQEDLEHAVNLGRTFEVAICLEVGEHLAPERAEVLISTLTAHADRIYFSAACPGQLGEHHVNCQWPAYWQRIFNAQGYACEDSIRWLLWDLPDLEFWYRQNVFLAQRRPEHAGHEPRIPPVIHPAMLAFENESAVGDLRLRLLRKIEEGSQSVGWYFATPARALGHKLTRHLSPRQRGSIKGNQ
jgi:SAM-dependent methyltransferase